jgi:Na+/alanine symporter
LGSLESYWNVLWMLFVETSILAIFLFVEFVLAYERLHRNLYALLITPPVVTLVGSLIVFFSPRGSQISNGLHSMLIAAAILVNIIGLFQLMKDFASEVHEAGCEEREMKVTKMKSL